MVDALWSDRANQSLHVCILPRRCRCDGSIPDAQATQTSLHDRTIDGVTVSDEIGGCLIPGKCLDNLPGNPLRGRVRCCRIVDEPPSAVVQDDQAIEQLKPIVGTTNRST